MTILDRRHFLRDSLKYAGGAVIAPSLAGLVACNDAELVAPAGASTPCASTARAS